MTGLTPWARAALTDEQYRDLARRARELDCEWTAGMSRHTWTIRIASKARRTVQSTEHVTYTQPLHRLDDQIRGDLYRAVMRLLGKYESLYVWTPDEILAIANQSGVAVSRG